MALGDTTEGGQGSAGGTALHHPPPLKATRVTAHAESESNSFISFETGV